jgi:hypothetical protein
MRQVVWRVAWGVLFAVGAFVFWHSGGRADALCTDHAFVPSDGLSLWPPGAACTYGEPATTDTLLNPLFFITVVIPLVAGVLLGELLERSALVQRAQQPRH